MYVYCTYLCSGKIHQKNCLQHAELQSIVALFKGGKKKSSNYLYMFKNKELILSHQALQFAIQISHQNGVIKNLFANQSSSKSKVNIPITICQHSVLTIEKALLSIDLKRLITEQHVLFCLILVQTLLK